MNIIMGIIGRIKKSEIFREFHRLLGKILSIIGSSLGKKFSSFNNL